VRHTPDSEGPVIGFPLLIIPFAIYNMIAFLTPMDWATKLYTFQLKSGLAWEPTAGDAFLVFSLLMLMFEFIKSTRHGKSLVEHFIALLLVGGATAEFVMLDPAKIMKGAGPIANSTFAIFIAICFVDLFAGFAASLRRARRAVVVAPEPVVVQTPPPRTGPVRVESARSEPFTRVEPAPAVKIEPVQKVEP
jgi:hypothetical protein